MIVRSIVVALACVMSFARSGNACSCISSTVLQVFERADAVFAGRVIDIDRSEPAADEHGRVPLSVPVTYTFEIEAVWKGSSRTIVEVIATSSESACGYVFELDASYVVFAGENAGELWTDFCAGNELLSEAEKAIMKLPDPVYLKAGFGLPDVSVAALLEGLAALDPLVPDVKLAQRLIEALGILGPAAIEAVPTLTTLMTEGHEFFVEMVVEALVRISPGSPAVRSACRTLMESERHEARARMLEAAWRRDVDELWELPTPEQAVEDRGAPVRSAAFYPSVRGKPRAMIRRRALAAMKDPEASVREDVLSSIRLRLQQDLGDSLYASVFSRAASDPDSGVRAMAIVGLGLLASDATRDSTIQVPKQALVLAVRDPIELNRRNALNALERLAGAGLLDPEILCAACSDTSARIRDRCDEWVKEYGLECRISWPDSLRVVPREPE